MRQTRYQVFVSSTYIDLVTERRNVIQTLLSLDCIPAGMELFPAADEDQLTFIERVIDDCDYYVVIVAGRYGSVDGNGVSYTEREYDYAVESGIRVIALIHQDPDSLPKKHCDDDPIKQAKLKAFCSKLQQGRIVDTWREPTDLPGKVAVAVANAIKMYPARGWVRAPSVSFDDLLQELNEVKYENIQLREHQPKHPEVDLDLTPLEEEFSLDLMPSSFSSSAGSRPHTVTLPWVDLFAIIAPHILVPRTDADVAGYVARRLNHASSATETLTSLRDPEWNTVKVQFLAHGLVSLDPAPNVSRSGEHELHWSLTPAGKALMLNICTV